MAIGGVSKQTGDMIDKNGHIESISKSSSALVGFGRIRPGTNWDMKLDG